MKQKFNLEVVLLAIISIISLVSFYGLGHAFDVAASPVNSINGDTNSSQYIVRQAGFEKYSSIKLDTR